MEKFIIRLHEQLNQQGITKKNYKRKHNVPFIAGFVFEKCNGTRYDKKVRFIYECVIKEFEKEEVK